MHCAGFDAGTKQPRSEALPWRGAATQPCPAGLLTPGSSPKTAPSHLLHADSGNSSRLTGHSGATAADSHRFPCLPFAYRAAPDRYGFCDDFGHYAHAKTASIPTGRQFSQITPPDSRRMFRAGSYRRFEGRSLPARSRLPVRSDDHLRAVFRSRCRRDVFSGRVKANAVK